MRPICYPLAALSLVFACSDDASSGVMPTGLPTLTEGSETNGDGDPSGDGDGDPSGDGDGDPGPYCGDGIVDDDEECDVGNETMFCDGDCTYTVCGDGYHNMLSEECDDGNEASDDGCVGACLLNVCGDGFLWEGVETCDDENLVDTDECTNACVLAACGDGIIWEDEETCDDQNLVDTDECTNACLVASCGDGVLWENEETCDDGNLEDTDACPGSCEPAVCGDGYTYVGVEECDDGNNEDDDGCDSACVWENGGVFELAFDDSVVSDDIVDTALLDLFNSVQNPLATDFVYFEVSGDVNNSGAWCATRGDWYHDQYVSNYGDTTSLLSGNWDKWSSADGTNWSATINQGFTNYYGAGCDSTPGSWCSEWGMGQQSLNLLISPQKNTFETYGDGWNSGDASFVFRYASNRFAACGF